MKRDSTRHEQILGRLSTARRVGVAEMAGEFGVSMETIRRDLKLLEERGHHRRIRGGAVPPVAQQDLPLHERSRLALTGIASVDQEGFMDFADDVAELRRGLVRQVRQTAVLADHTKFGRRARIRTFRFSDAQALVTDRPPPPAYSDAMLAAGQEVIHA